MRRSVRLEVLAWKAAAEFLVVVVVFRGGGGGGRRSGGAHGSGAVLSPQVLKLTLCAHSEISLCAETPRRAGRRRSATSDRTCTSPHSVLTLDYDKYRLGFIKRQPCSPCRKRKKNHRDLSLHPERIVVPLLLSGSLTSPQSPALLSSSLGCGVGVLTLLGVHSLLIVPSSSLSANYSLWPSPLVPPPVLTYSTRRHTRTFPSEKRTANVQNVHDIYHFVSVVIQLIFCLCVLQTRQAYLKYFPVSLILFRYILHAPLNMFLFLPQLSLAYYYATYCAIS